MTGSLKKKSQPNLLKRKHAKTNNHTHQNFLLCLYYHLVQFQRILLLDCVFVFSPVTQELCQYWSSSAQLSPTSSVKTPSEPCSYYKLLILWFLQRFSCRDRNTGPGLVRSPSSTSQFPQQWLESKWFWVVNRRWPPPDSSVSSFHKPFQGLHVDMGVPQKEASSHPKLTKYNTCNNYISQQGRKSIFKSLNPFFIQWTFIKQAQCTQWYWANN